MKKLLLPFLLLGWIGVSSQTSKVFQEAERLNQQGEFQASTSVLQKFIKENPRRNYDLAQAYFLMSKNYLLQGAFPLATASNKRSLAFKEKLLTDDLAENYLRYGEIALAQGEYESAFSSLYKAKELPNNTELFASINATLAQALAENGQLPEALFYLGQSSELMEIELGEEDPLYIQALYQIGTIQLQKGAPYEANKVLMRARDLQQKIGPEEAFPVKFFKI